MASENRVLKLWAQLNSVQVSRMNAKLVREAKQQLREDWAEYKKPGETYAHWRRHGAVCYNEPRTGWCWVLELNEEDVASEYGFASYEAAVLACARRYMRKALKPQGMLREVLAAALTDWWFAANDTGQRKVYEQGSTDTLCKRHYLLLMEKWWGMANRHEYPALARALRLPYDPKLYGEVCNSELHRMYWQDTIARYQHEELRATVRDLLTVETMRAALQPHKVTCTPALAGEGRPGEWHWYDSTGAYAGWGRNEHDALAHACLLHGLFNMGLIYGTLVKIGAPAK